MIVLGLLAVPRAAGTDLIEVDLTHGEIRIKGRIQKDPTRPIHGDWGKKSTAFVGVAGGSQTKDFIVVMDVDRADIYRAAETLGWRAGRRLTLPRAMTRRGLKATTTIDDYMTGDPVLCALEFERNGRPVRQPLEAVIRCRIRVDDVWIEKPYTPHFVFTGAGEENGIASGCVYCPSDCVGALFTDNSGPVQTEAEEFRVDWEKLPPAGGEVTVLMRSIH